MSSCRTRRRFASNAAAAATMRRTAVCARSSASRSTLASWDPTAATVDRSSPKNRAGAEETGSGPAIEIVIGTTASLDHDRHGRCQGQETRVATPAVTAGTAEGDPEFAAWAGAGKAAKVTAPRR